LHDAKVQQQFNYKIALQEMVFTGTPGKTFTRLLTQHLCYDMALLSCFIGFSEEHFVLSIVQSLLHY